MGDEPTGGGNGRGGAGSAVWRFLRPDTIVQGVVTAVVVALVTGGPLALLANRSDSDKPARETTTTPPIVTTPVSLPPLTLPTVPTTQPRGVPKITLSRPSGPPGTRLTVSGTGYPPGAEVEINFSTDRLATAVANAAGAFGPVPVQIPSAWPFRNQVRIVASTKAPVAFDDEPFQVT